MKLQPLAIPTRPTLVLILLLLGPLHVQAGPQDGGSSSGPTPPPGVSAQLQGLLGGVLKPPAKSASVTPLPTTFTSTGKPLFVDEMLSKLTLQDDAKQQFRTYAGQVMQLVETTYKENGYPTNDLGVALGGLLEVCYEIDHDTFKASVSDKAEQAADKKQTNAAVRQMQRVLGGAPGFGSLSDKSKQLAYEACTFTIGHLAVSWQQAGKDKDKHQAVRQLARQQIENLFRLDPDALARNPEGAFVPKKKTAADGVEEAKPEGTKEPSGEGAAKEPTGGNAETNAPSMQATAAAPPEAALVAGPTLNLPTPAGWKSERLEGGITLLTPQNLASGETFSVAVFPLRPLTDKPIDDWLTAAITGDTLPPGKPASEAKVKGASANVASGTMFYTAAGGANLIGVYSALTMDRATVRLVRVLSTADSKVLNRYTKDANTITTALIQADKKGAVAAGRGLDMEKVPTKPEGMSPGGPLQPGVYGGTQLYGDEVNNRYRLYLYPNRQYRLFNAEGKQVNSDVRLGYTYDHLTGKLDLESGMQYDMRNDRFDPDEDKCLYGYDAAGKPYVYARSNRGFRYATTVLRYVGPLDKPSPQDEADKKAWAEAEAKRYKWVVAPGQGLKPSEIAGIVHNSVLHQFYNGSGLSVSSTHDLYLLLADGTVYNGLPVAPDELDIARSRRNEPEKWGRWKRVGTNYLAAWPDAPTQFLPLKGESVKPGAKGTKLAGRFGTGETSGSLMGGSFRLWGVTFTSDGHFRQDNRGGYGSSTFAETGGMASINSNYDDEGSSTSATGENFVVATSKKKKPGADRSGTYSVEGYVLVLHYDDGRVVRQPFFFEDAQRDAIWFQGALLAFDKEAAK